MSERGGFAPPPVSLVQDLIVEQLADTGQAWFHDHEAEAVRTSKGDAIIRAWTAPEPEGDAGRHIYIDFILNPALPDLTTISDMATIVSTPSVDGVREALGGWRVTSGAAACELLDRTGRFAVHLDPDSPDAYPGWHSITGSVSGWDAKGDDSNLLAHKLATGRAWQQISSLIEPSLGREFLNTVRYFIGTDTTERWADVHVSGQRHDAASDAMASLPWPTQSHIATARAYFLLIHRTGAADGPVLQTPYRGHIEVPAPDPTQRRQGTWRRKPTGRP